MTNDQVVHFKRNGGIDLRLGRQKSFIWGKQLIADYFSQYPIVIKLTCIKASSVVLITKSIFGMFGLVKEIVADKGPQFIGVFDEFCKTWNIVHKMSSPRHAQ